jgi:hypothetical protein
MESGLKGSLAAIDMADEGVAGGRKGFGLREWEGGLLFQMHFSLIYAQFELQMFEMCCL